MSTTIPELAGNERTFMPEIKWIMPLRQLEDPHYLLGIVDIGGVSFHAEAWEATDELEDGEELQVLLGEHAESGDAILDRVVNGAASTLHIDGKDYVLAITPFER